MAAWSEGQHKNTGPDQEKKSPVSPNYLERLFYADSLLGLYQVSWKVEGFSKEAVSLAKDADEPGSRLGPDIWSWVTEGSRVCRAESLLQEGVAPISDYTRKLQTNASQKWSLCVFLESLLHLSYLFFSLWVCEVWAVTWRNVWSILQDLAGCKNMVQYQFAASTLNRCCWEVVSENTFKQTKRPLLGDQSGQTPHFPCEVSLWKTHC